MKKVKRVRRSIQPSPTGKLNKKVKAQLEALASDDTPITRYAVLDNGAYVIKCGVLNDEAERKEGESALPPPR